MTKALHHPERDQIELASVLDALSDPIRLQVVKRLAAEGQCACSTFLDYGQKTNLTYHLARLREAGVTRARAEGAFRIISLRTDDLEARFPGLLTAILASVKEVAVA
jgi:DNA-binding transcriptional ArsR family regulator